MNRLALVLVGASLCGHAAATPLAERIWVPDEGRFTRPAEVEHAVAEAHYVLLGEEHPVARHHILQARLIRAAAQGHGQGRGQGRRSAVILEMIPRSLQTAIEDWRAAPEPDVTKFGPAVGWRERGWPDWGLYAPIARAALAQDLPLIAGAPSPERLRAVARSGLEALTAERRQALRLDQPLPPKGRARLLTTLREVHCGQLHAPAAERMLAIQRLRDASMAERLRAAATDDGAILIAGHGHVRRDYGVPRYLDGGPDEVVSIAFRTTGGLKPGGGEGGGERLGRIEDHVAASGGALPYDYVWFTEGQVPIAACEDNQS